MDAPRILLQKRTFLTKKRLWVFAVIFLVVIVGTGIQMHMTWNRERLRGITTDAVDFMHTTTTEFSSVLPPRSTFDPLFDLFTSVTASPTADTSVPPESPTPPQP